MNFLKALFGSKKENPEEKRKEDEAKNFDVLKYGGVAALKTNQVEYAIRCFNHALHIKDDLEVRDYLSQALMSNGELLPAYEQLQKLAEAQPDNEQILLRMANVAYMMEDYGAMGDACEKAMLINKDDPQVLFLYARACIGQGDQVNAIAMLTKAITQNADFVDAYLLRGETLLKMGDVAGAAEDADLLVSKVEGNEDVLLLKARVEEAKGNHDQAVAIYNKVIEVNPFCANAFRERGAIRKALGDLEGAEEDMKSVLELSPDEANGSPAAAEADGIQHKTEQKYKEMNPYGF
ncbi:tetratricopeptide repeat protein [Prevotella sp. kh1p2]|uniref:tetratricopeptide repeat protein n=1 Tax=Prevotella sp. kh1p2 TaxID=1761883 RepID=UPI0008C4BC4C|nr:tetratricopeptide repeat protein [Prevotella sp. kh1p2]SES95141.1 TPR repeat-containing protein [Prevotella sp. kh1p2]SNU11271.1 TPR repeat-containing protein [Prevotellaceae bacterium KH2P17]